MENKKKIEMTENELWVIGMLFEEFGSQAEKSWAWSDDDWKAYQSIKNYLTDKQYMGAQD
jgi:hypothetical protein